MDLIATPASVRRELNQKFAALAIFKRDRATALYHLASALEMTTDPFTVNLDLVMALGRRALEASMRAIPAIYRNCSISSVAPTEVQFNPAVFREALDLVEFAFRYDQIMYCFELADRGQFEVRYDPLEERTLFQYASQDESARDTLLRSHERDANFELAAEADKAVILKLAQEARQELEPTILPDQPYGISYRMTPALLAVAKQWAEVLAKARRWEFPEDLVIGNLTLGEVRKFWSAVAVLVNLNEMAHMIVSEGQAKMRPPASVAAIRSRDEWCALIQEIAVIGAGAASELLWWYTFDPKVSEATAPIQPLLAIPANNLILVTNLVNHSNVERNLQKLLNRHPQLRSFYAPLKAAKEKIALTYLAGLFQSPGFAVKPTVIIKGVTDADLLVYERASGFVLVIQHKWLIAPETVSESSSNDEQLREGARQAVAARDVFRKDHALLRSVLELPNDQPVERVEAAVICRGAEQTGFLGQQAVPVALERAFEELWEQSSHSLSKLWERLSSRPDHTGAASRYGDTSAHLTVGGIRFSFPALSLEVQP
jgi:hypothetical protein